MKIVPQEWRVLSQTLHKIPTIKQSRVSPAKLYEANKKEMTFVHMDEKGVYAFGAIWPTRSKKWFEIGTIWVRPDYEGKGISSEIITTLHKRLRNLKKSAFLCCSDKNKRMQGTVLGMDYKTCADPLNSPLAKAWGKNRSTSGRSIFYFEHTS